jgi:glutamine amidotransferase-like uncharacterized protein
MGISIFTGEGAMPLPLPGCLLSAADIVGTSWDASCSLFIMPGGRDRPYHAALQGEGCRRIRQYVENGGTYLGICAGAYFAAERVEFDPGFPLEVCEDRELAFFRGAAVGPAYGNGSFDYNNRRGARAAKLKTEEGEFHAYYNGGCTFKGDLSNCQILARYADLPGEPPAILECQVGKGKAILSGVHLEAAAESLDRYDPFLAEFIPILIASESFRRRYWEQLLGHAP